MPLKKWSELPEQLQRSELLPYYEQLQRKRLFLWIKRGFDLVVALGLTILLLPLLLALALAIKLDSKGSVFYRQIRITQYARPFRIFKFRTMVEHADRNGPLITVSADARVTRIGRVLRKYKLDELPQLLNILTGEMSFVGTRPEVPKYVERYSPKMLATLLLPAGVTSLSSIRFRNEEALLSAADDVDAVYVREILPQKMQYNLQYFQTLGFLRDISIMLQTISAVFRKNRREG